jgi:predicted dienelactone hydrolase
MHKITKIILSITACLSLIGCFGSNVQNNSNNNYLMKPTGQYAIGYQDFHFQDNSRTDPYYKEGNESDFSPENTNHNREIMVRVYYPTNGSPKLGDLMYAPLVKRFVNLATEAPNMQPSYINELYTIRSYSEESSPILTTNSKFPVVLFSHGGGSSVQEYENQITNLVSHGYIVIGVNSFFIGSWIGLPNGHIVLSKELETKQLLETQKNDIKFIMNNLNQLPSSIYNKLDTKDIGLIGHSDGGGAIELLVSQENSSNQIKAAIAEDGNYGDDPSGKTISIDGFNIPFMHILSGSIGYAPKFLKFQLSYKLNKDNFVIGMAPNDTILWSGTYPFYTVHAEFSDENTLKNMHGFQVLNQDFIDFSEQKQPLWSNTSSDYIVATINQNTLEFFNHYLKGQNSPTFSDCNVLVNNSLMVCGNNTNTYGPFQNFN